MDFYDLIDILTSHSIEKCLVTLWFFWFIFQRIPNHMIWVATVLSAPFLAYFLLLIYFTLGMAIYGNLDTAASFCFTQALPVLIDPVLLAVAVLIVHIQEVESQIKTPKRISV